MNDTTHKYFQNAFTSTPVQNNLGSIAFLSNGLSRLEFFALFIYTSKSVQNETLRGDILTIKECIELAAEFIIQIDDFKNKIENPPSKIIE